MPLDIVIFGVIAVILIFRFLGVLGQNDKDDGRPRRDAFGNYKKAVEEQRARRAEQRAQRQSRVAAKAERTEDSTESDRSPERLATATKPAAVAKDREKGGEEDLLDKAFLEGAKAAYPMILDAYAMGELDKLAALLDKEMFERMQSDIEARQKAEQRLEISLLEIVEARIVERSQDSRFEQVTVAFTSKQCHLVFDKDNKLIEGNPDEEELLSDLWTFRQELSSEDPTWYLCATRAQGTPKKASAKTAKGKTKAKPQATSERQNESRN